MKKLIITVLSLCTYQSAFGLEYSVHSCDFFRVKGNDQWVMDMAGIYGTSYLTSLGWNETALISKATFINEVSGEFGLCSSVNSHSPDSVNINIHFVEGKNLNMVGTDCMFTGDNLTVTSHSQPLTSNEDSLAKVHEVNLGGTDLEFLHIAGVTPKVEEDLLLACTNAFNKHFPQSKSVEVRSSFVYKRL